MSRRKQRSAFDQVPEFDKGRIECDVTPLRKPRGLVKEKTRKSSQEAYRDYGLSFKEIGSRVGRSQATAMQICDRWMQDDTTDRSGRSHSPQCTTLREDRQNMRMAVTDRSVISRTVVHQQDNARPHLSCIVQRFFVNHQIELLSWPAHSPDLSPIGNMWSMVAQRLTQITPPAATPDQLWQRVVVDWSAVPQGHIRSLFESMPRREVAVISNNGGFSGY
ncbi:transposable element Tcb1 transposase [Trichonephila clavipes]|nr:transposable element Tcb1 transposase [Trichonephila clavipes]